MTPAQSEILGMVRQSVGDDAADAIARGWAEDGIDQPRSDRPTAQELAKIVAWRFDPDVRRRQIAIARLARYGYDVSLARARQEQKGA